MATHYLKRGQPRRPETQDALRDTVARMLAEIEVEGAAAVRRYAERFDGWTGPIEVDEAEWAAAEGRLSAQLKRDIQLSFDKVRAFAEAQRASITPFEVSLGPGLITGQRLVPVQTAGCYVPGGLFAHIASAIMSVTTAKVAGVEEIVVASPPRRGEGIDPAILYAARLCGAHRILSLGGVQALAALAFGTFGGRPADILVGPGNAYVAEAKRQLYGRVGIDLYAGPTEILVIADGSADPERVAVDLVSQAEHGAGSPAWLVSLSEPLARAVLQAMPRLIADLPSPNREAAEAAWRDYGEVAVVDTREEAVALSDAYAPEHLEVQTEELDYYLGALRNYGSLFLGPETCVTFGDKSSGPNHILPTLGAARYTGGLWVGKFIKVLSYQRMSADAAADLAPVAGRLSRAEGMEGHARAADIRERP